MKKLFICCMAIVFLACPNTMLAQKRSSAKTTQSTQTSTDNSKKASTYDELMNQGGQLLEVTEKKIDELKLSDYKSLSFFDVDLSYEGKSIQFIKLHYGEKDYTRLLYEKEGECNLSTSEIQNIRTAINKMKEKTTESLPSGTKKTLLYATTDGKFSVYCEHSYTSSWYLFIDRNLVSLTGTQLGQLESLLSKY